MKTESKSSSVVPTFTCFRSVVYRSYQHTVRGKYNWLFHQLACNKNTAYKMFLFKGIQNRYFIIQMLLSFFFKMSYVFEYIIVFGEENTKIKRIHCLDQSMYIWVSCRRYYNLPRKLSELTINSLAITPGSCGVQSRE